MLQRLKNRKLKKRISKEGTLSECKYMVYLNNDEPRTFDNRSELQSFLEKYRSTNEIFRLQIFRVEVYSL